MRTDLLQVAHRIAANQHRAPTRPLVALRKLFIQERRDWARPGAPRIGWKRGELIEFVFTPSAEEWGDIGYYVAQTWSWLWWLYAAITPGPIIARAVEKFAARAEKRGNMTTNQAIQKVEEMAGNYASKDGIVWGIYSSRVEDGIKVQSFTRTYHYADGSKRTICYDAATDEIY